MILGQRAAGGDGSVLCSKRQRSAQWVYFRPHKNACGQSAGKCLLNTVFAVLEKYCYIHYKRHTTQTAGQTWHSVDVWMSEEYRNTHLIFRSALHIHTHKIRLTWRTAVGKEASLPSMRAQIQAPQSSTPQLGVVVRTSTQQC